MYTYKFMKSVRVITVSAVLSRVPYGYVFLQRGATWHHTTEDYWVHRFGVVVVELRMMPLIPIAAVP